VAGQNPATIFIQTKIKRMANMSYCRFENTYNDLIDCLEHIETPCENERDERYRIRFIKLLAENIDLIEEIKDEEPQYQ
jgi:hypothetical protein